MKKNFVRKMLSVVAVAAMTISMVGCGAAGGSADAGDVIKIGIMTDTSGDNALTCNVSAFQIAIDEINAAGGVLGKQIKPLFVDGQGNTQRYQELSKKLIMEDNCAVVFQDGTSANREACRPVFEENKKLLIYPTFYEGGVASRYCFCTGCNPEQSILPLMQYVKDKNIGSKVYIIAADYNYGQISAQWVQEYCKDLGLEVVGTEFSPLGTSQFSSSIAKIQESGADCVYTLLVGAAQCSFFDQWVSTGIDDIQLVSTCNIAYSFEQKKTDGLTGMIAAANFFEDMAAYTDKAKEFVDTFRSKYPDEAYITLQADSAYTAIKLWAAACEKAGSVETEAVIDAFDTDEVSVEGPSGKVSVDGATHQCTLTVSLMQVQDDNSLALLETYENLEPSYLKALGVDIRKEDPHTQYSPLESGTGN